MLLTLQQPSELRRARSCRHSSKLSEPWAGKDILSPGPAALFPTCSIILSGRGGRWWKRCQDKERLPGICQEGYDTCLGLVCVFSPIYRENFNDSQDDPGLSTGCEACWLKKSIGVVSLVNAWWSLVPPVWIGCQQITTLGEGHHLSVKAGTACQSHPVVLPDSASTDTCPTCIFHTDSGTWLCLPKPYRLASHYTKARNT